MSEFGVKILNISCGSIYECNLGVRDQLDTKEAMLTNSLFLDFLMDNGLKLWKGESTRDVICIEFNYGSRSYKEEVAHLNRILDGTDDEDKAAHVRQLLSSAEENRNKYDKKSKQELRTIFYRDGVDVTYKTHNRKGEVIKSETIHYQMLYRTPGKAKVGKCMFICDRLFDKAQNFLRMGIELPEKNAPIIEIGAYSSLITSTIVGRISIPPENLLIIKDFDSPFRTNVVSIETDENRECHAIRRENYELKNAMFDGQALIDTSIFPSWADGYVLLRHHMTKCAAFHADIQQFFRDYCEEREVDYDTLELLDMWGNPHRAKDIQLITTDNAIKWLKFDVSYDYWANKVRENGSLWGVVKTAHQSKLGDVQQMSYQMLNALNIDSMQDVMTLSDIYIHNLQNDDEEFLEYLEKNQNFSNDYEVLLALVRQNPNFIRSEYFKSRRKKILNNYIHNMKTGKVVQNADNLTIVGSPYAMLLHAVGEDPASDPTFENEDGCIQCWTERFADGEYLAEFRNPFNSCNNLGYLHNHHHEYFNKYLRLGRQIIAVNMVGTDFQSRNNGADQDSDSIYVTNQPSIVAHAKYCYDNYPTIENNIPKEKNKYNNTLEDYAKVDNKLAAAQLAIGESSNLAQICLTYTYNYQDQKYDDYVCILSVIAQAAIDNAKRAYNIDIPSEIRRIKKDMNLKENGYPLFWKEIRPEFKNKSKSLINKELRCPMNEVCSYRLDRSQHYTQTIPNYKFFNNYKMSGSKRKSKKIELLIQRYSLRLYGYNTEDSEHNVDDYLLLRDDFDKLISDIRQTYISNNYLGLMSWLISRALGIDEPYDELKGQAQSILCKNRSLLMKVLYTISPSQFLQIFDKDSEN